TFPCPPCTRSSARSRRCARRRRRTGRHGPRRARRAGRRRRASGSPARIRGPPFADLVPVVAVVDDEAVLVESERGRAGEGHSLAVLDPRPPPLDDGAVAGRRRLAEPALDLLLDTEVLLEVRPNTPTTLACFAERMRPVQRGLGVESDDRLGVLRGPGTRP